MSETLNKAKAAKEKLSTKSVIILFKSVIEQWKNGKHSEAVHSAIAIIVGITTGKLGGLMKEVEKRKKKIQSEKEEPKGAVEDETSEEQKEFEDPNTPEPNKPKKPETTTTPPKIDIAKFRKGDLFDSLAINCPYAEIKSRLTQPDYKPYPVNGIPGWEKGNKTDNWDYGKEGNNTDKLIKEGEYKVDMIVGKRKNAPAKTHEKLARIAVALQHDPRMPLFTGIDMVVDGIKVTMVKEIHCWNRSETNSKTLGQPHIGTAYIIKS